MRGSSRDPRRVVRRQGWTFDPDAYEGARYPDPTLGFAFDPTTRAGLWQDGSGQQDRPITARWYQSDADQSAGPLEPPIVAFDPATAGAGMWPEQPAEWRPTTWPQPDWIEGATPLQPLEGGLWPLSGLAEPPDPQQDRSRAARWFQSDTEAWTPIPDLTVASVEQQAALWPEQPGQERPTTPTWFAPEAAVEPIPQGSAFTPLSADQLAWLTAGEAVPGASWALPPDDDSTPFTAALTPPFDPATGFDWSEQPAEWRPQTWFQSDTEAWTPIPDLTVATPDQVDRQEQPQDWRPVVWFAPEAAVTPFTAALTPAFDPAPIVPALAEQPAAWSPQRWLGPDDAFESPLPLASPLTPLAAEFLAGLWIDQSGQQDRSIQPTWADPHAWSVEGLVPEVPAFDPSASGGLWPEQPADWRPTVWFQPDDSATPFVPAAAPFDPASGFDWSEQPGQERDQAQRWFAPDDDYLPVALTFPTTASVEAQAPLWPEQPGQERPTTPTWFAPEAETWTPIPNLGGIFEVQWTPALYFDPDVRWRVDFSPDMIEAHFAGTLQDWLLLTWDLTPGGGVVPKVLIDATTGDPFVHLEGPFIARAD